MVRMGENISNMAKEKHRLKSIGAKTKAQFKKWSLGTKTVLEKLVGRGREHKRTDQHME